MVCKSDLLQRCDFGRWADRHSWHETSGREFQMSKETFGPGIWRLQVELRNIAISDEKFVTVKFPDQLEENAFFELIVRSQ